MNIELSQLIPLWPLHWTSIMHYILILGTLAILFLSGENTSIIFLVILAVLALLTGADLYIGKYEVPRIIIFVFRVFMFGIPLVLAGISPTEETRTMGLIAAAIALPIFVITFFTCLLPWGLGDPRILIWCVP